VHVLPDLVDERNGDGLLVGVERDVRRSRRGEWGGIAGLDEGCGWCWCAWCSWRDWHECGLLALGWYGRGEWTRVKDEAEGADAEPELVKDRDESVKG